VIGSVAPSAAEAAEQLTFLYEARAAISVIQASVDLGVLRRLEDGWADVDTLGRDCAIDPRSAPALLAVLVRLGLAESDGRGRYRARRGIGSGFLDLLGSWDGLAESLRAGTIRRPRPPGEVYPRIVNSLATLFAPAASAAAAHLAGGRHRRVLDLGAGAAPWTIAMATRDPSCLITAIDLPPVIESTRQAASAARCDRRFQFVTGDLFEVELDGAPFDLVVAGNLCHLFDEAANRRLFQRVAEWLAPGGTVAVIDLLSDEWRDPSRAVMLYGLGLCHRTTGGQVYPFTTYVRWLREAGLHGVERHELSAYPPVSLITARRGDA
jgi:ubiquinone/menaquinone biosynthesis C-methylase UbiE